ncbi:MAG: protein-L-isoaspartate(D-aspartate) O-methyltransferase [Verrucomicrobiota bacterium]
MSEELRKHDTPEAQRYRNAMVEFQLERHGFTDSRLLQAFREVPRHCFCPPGTSLADAYGDFPLSIGEGQTISQPRMVASMTEQLKVKGSDKVLEVGTGSGYQTAILALLAGEVYSIENIPELAESARAKLTDLGFDNIHLEVGDGSQGWEDYAPYDGIIVTAAAPDIPEPLKNQLADNGRLVIPTGSRGMQHLTIVTRHNNKFSTQTAEACCFVPLLGRHGWQ